MSFYDVEGFRAPLSAMTTEKSLTTKMPPKRTYYSLLGLDQDLLMLLVLIGVRTGAVLTRVICSQLTLYFLTLYAHNVAQLF